MKIKNLVLIIASVLVSQSAVAAVFSLYNESHSWLEVTVYYGSVINPPTLHLPKGKKLTFKSGINVFTKLRWMGPDGICYEELIPSSRTMLMGTIVLRGGSELDINFDEWGSSAGKTHNRYADKCK